VPDGAKGPPACALSKIVKLNMCGNAGGPSVRGLWPISPTVARCRRGSMNQP
jgi:hypothetical protein